MMIVTYQKIFSYIEGAKEGSVTDVLRLWIADYMEKIREKLGSKKCWEERILYLVHETDKADFKEESVWYSPDAYNKLDLQTCCKIIDYSNCWDNDRKNGKWYERRKKIKYSIPEVYNLDEDTADVVIREHTKRTKRKSLSYLREARNLKAHPKNIRESDKVRNSDLVHFIEGMKTFLSSLPMEQAPILKEPIQRLLVQLHEMWEVLPEDERDGTEWEVEDLIPELTKKNIVRKISNHNKSESQPKEPKPFVPTQTHGIDDTKTRPQPKSPMRVNRENPQLILFLVDESKSMAEYLENQNGKPITRGEVVVQKMTKALFDMVEDCQVDGEDKNYYYVSLLGYCGSDNSKPEDLYDWAADADAELKNAAIRPLLIMNDFRKDKWMKYSPIGRTPMKPAFERAFELIKEWDNLKENYSEEELEKLSKERRKEILATSQLISKENNGMWTFREMNRGGCHPPIIINISDGRFDNKMYGEKPDLTFSPEKVIQNMKNYQYKNFSEPPVVMNLYISSGDDKQTLEFPDKRPSGDDEYLKHMFDISSTLSQNMLTCAREYPEYSQLPNSARALIYNADSVGLETILRIGTIGTRMGITETAESRDDPGY